MSGARGRSTNRRRQRKRAAAASARRQHANETMWTPARHQATPAGLCFPTAEAWRAWLHRAHERYGELDVLTLTSCPPGVLVLFQRPGGEWLDAAVIDELLALDADRARPGLAPYNRDASRPRAVSHR